MPASEDYDLLRRYEPILVFSPDERFFPIAVEDFVRQSAMWSIPLKVGRLPLFRRRWKPFSPQENMDEALAQMADERARNGFVYLQYVDRFALFLLLWQAWTLVAIEIGLTLLPLSIILRSLLELSWSLSPDGPTAQSWLDLLSKVLWGLSLSLALGGTVLTLVRRLLRGPDAFARLPHARLRSFQTIATLGLMASAITGALAVGPLAVFRSGDVGRGVALWVVGWLLAAVLIYYIPRFFRTGVLQLSSLFAILSGLNDGTADAAYKKIVEVGGSHHADSDERTYPYYGRVWPEDPEIRETYQYIALQYWYFYAFNDWRTRYNGIDDHEGDWEHITIILARDRPEAGLKPVYLVYSQHILPGAYLRRAWNDPGVTKVREGDNWHPVAYVAAGSHAHYYRQGRHGLEELLRFSKAARRFYGAVLSGREKERTQAGMEVADVDLRIARMINLSFLGEYLLVWPRGGLPQIERVDTEEFVDYAGVSPDDPLSEETGLSIGPGQTVKWECTLIRDESPEWMRYNGNWGKYVAYSGESAPRGPRLASKLENRAEWADPVDAAGLIPEKLTKSQTRP